MQVGPPSETLAPHTGRISNFCGGVPANSFSQFGQLDRSELLGARLLHFERPAFSQPRLGGSFRETIVRKIDSEL
jgi:hypothetical protein